jgi:hypothetical protein
MKTKGKKTAATLPLLRGALHTRTSTDPLSVWNQSQRILFAVAHQVRLAIRVKLDGHGRAEAEAEELVHDLSDAAGRVVFLFRCRIFRHYPKNPALYCNTPPLPLHRPKLATSLFSVT